MPINIIISVVISLVLSVALSLVSSLLAPRPSRRALTQPSVPKPQDGQFNLKQNVPSIPIVLGRVKKGGDYVFLEESNGTVYHVTVIAAHRVNGFTDFYLHDERVVAFNEDDGVIDPVHFTGDNGVSGGSNVALRTKVGLSTETAWTELTSTFPSIWTADHRGDGLAQLLMIVNTVAEPKFLDTFPQQMPEPTVVVEGALVYDPREVSHDPDDPDTWAFSTNLALLKLHHITQPWGGRLSFSQVDLDEWATAADVCDEFVTNKAGDSERRYHGGLWFRAESDPSDIADKLSLAGDMVVYEKANGKVGVHAGAFVPPTIRITEDDIFSITVDANQRRSTTVLAVRGRFTDPDAVYATVDAAIYGDPYVSEEDGQRTVTIDNEVVQSHNHMQRLQKLKFTRANAVQVSLVVHYNPFGSMGQLPYHRFVRINYPSRGLDEAVLEIIGRPKLSYRDMTYTFNSIVVPENLYNFSAATEEGDPPTPPTSVTGTGVPTPTGFTVSFSRALVTGDRAAVYAMAEWDHLSDALIYEFEWQVADESEPAQSIFSKPGETLVASNYLKDDVQYRFRLRSRSNGANSPWTSYFTAYAVSDFPTGGATFSSDSLSIGANLTGLSDGKTGTLSVFVKFNGGDGSTQAIVCTNSTVSASRFSIYKNLSNQIVLRGRNAASTIILNAFTSGTLLADGEWHHILASWDLASGVAKLYIDNVSDVDAGSTITNDNIDYTTGDLFIGSDSTGTDVLNADLCDLWFDDQYIDIAVTANRRKFVTPDGRPRWLGTTGTNPTGSQPLLLCSIPYGSTDASPFVTNAGTGGGFTLSGAIDLVAGPGV